MLKFTIPGKVQAKQSARFFKCGNFIKSFQSEKVVNYANWVKQCFCANYPEHCPSVFSEKALVIKITVFFEIPKSFSNKKKFLANTGLLMPLVKPDCDNMAKGILDALNGIVYPDDKQIVDLKVKKCYADTPCAWVEVDVLNKKGF